MPKHLVITYADPANLADSVDLTFKIQNHRVADVWVKLVDIALKKYTIDDPSRFIGLHEKEKQIDVALAKINKSIDTINNFKPIIDRRPENIHDQDTLNYLHHIFEVYHGLLNDQSNEFWAQAPEEVHRALADLNINVHECEAVGRSTTKNPTHYVTWYQMPKLAKLIDSDYSLLKFGRKFGTLNMLYAEVGKTCLDLSIDNDNYIFDTAFQPFKHISADFFVDYFTEPAEEVAAKLANLKNYYDTHQQFFINKNLPWGHNHLKPGFIPLANLVDAPNNVVELLTTRQYVKSIKLI